LLTRTFGRFENFAHDCQQIFDVLGISVHPLATHLNHSLHYPYAAYYSTQTRALVAKLYRDDVERFAYEFSPDHEFVL
jgi:hypothetical protein